MDGKRVAVVVAHPAHLLTVAGLLHRYRPEVLALYRTDAAQNAALRAALPFRITTLGASEPESFARAVAGDFAYHAALGDLVFDWLRAARPDVVLGDAYEAYNYHHDVTRLLIDDAVERWRAQGNRIESHEFPLSCRPDAPGAPVRYGEFVTGPFRAVRLDAHEAAVKRELVATVGRVDPFVAHTAPLFARPEVEPYRAVPRDRDYTAPPPGLALYYDERGREVVAAGKHAQPILYRAHFVPLVRALGLAPLARAA